jgi:hypothetical protein
MLSFVRARLRRLVRPYLDDCVAARDTLREALRSRGLLLLALLAAVIYLPGLLWEFPLSDYRHFLATDEPKVVYGAALFPEDIMQRTDLRYATLLHYSVGTLMLLVKPVVVGVALASQGDIDTTMALFVTTALMGRLVVLGCAAGTVVLLYAAVRHLTHSAPAALLAAASAAFAPAFVEQSTVMLTNVPAALMLLLAALVSLRLLTVRAERLRAWALLGAVVAGFAFGAKYSTLPAVVLLGLAYLLHPAVRRMRWQAHARTLALGSVASLATFTFSTPSWIMRPVYFWASLQYESARVMATRSTLGEMLSSPAELQSYLFDLVLSFGAPTLLLWLGAALLAAWYLGRGDVRWQGVAWRRHVVLLGGVLAYVVLNGTALWGRYWVLVVPLLALWFGLVLGVLLARWQARGLRLAYGFCLLAGLSAWAAVLPNYWHDTRIEAARWLDAHTPPDAIVAVPDLPLDPLSRWRVPAGAGRTLVEWPEQHDYLVVASSWDYRQTSRVMILWDDYRFVREVLAQAPSTEEICTSHGPHSWAVAAQHSVPHNGQQVVWYRNIWPPAALCRLYEDLPTQVGSEQGCYRLEAVVSPDVPFLPRVTRAQVPEFHIFRAVCERHDASEAQQRRVAP